MHVCQRALRGIVSKTRVCLPEPGLQSFPLPAVPWPSSIKMRISLQPQRSRQLGILRRPVGRWAKRCRSAKHQGKAQRKPEHSCWEHIDACMTAASARVTKSAPWFNSWVGEKNSQALETEGRFHRGLHTSATGHLCCSSTLHLGTQTPSTVLHPLFLRSYQARPPSA